MNQEECLQIVRASTRARKYVMVQQEKSPSEPEKHNTEFVTEKNWFSFDKVSISSMKIQPKVYTDSSKCLWRRSCWFCKYFCCWLGRCCFKHLHGSEHTFALIQQPAASCLFGCLTLTSTGTSLPLSFESLLCFLLTTFSCFTVELKASFSGSLSVRCSVFHRQILFVFAHAASEDGVVACTCEILMFSRSFHS